MILAFVIAIVALVIALWISVMLLWWRSEQEKPVKTIKRRDVVRTWNKAARLARRSWYGSMRYTKQASAWGNKKVRTAFIAVFPKSKPAFVKKDPLTGLEHGPSSYFLANLTKVPRSKKRTALRRKKIQESEIDLSEE
jgi:hypothetical protein